MPKSSNVFRLHLLLTMFALSPHQALTQMAPTVVHPSRSEQTVSIGAFGWVTLRNPLHQPPYIAQGTSTSGGVSAAYQQQLRPLVGYRANFAWTRVDEVYTSTAYQTAGTITYMVPTRLSVPNNVYELSTTYVVQQAANKSHWRAFGEFGPGVLIFSPTKAPFAGYTSYRAAAVYGAGAEFEHGPRWGLRLSYRGYFYKNPDFGAQASGPTRDKFFTYTSGPAASLTYRFR